jgi:hypothetical protein
MPSLLIAKTYAACPYRPLFQKAIDPTASVLSTANPAIGAAVSQ